MALAAVVGADTDALDVARAQRVAAVHEPPLHDRAVRDELVALADERVHAAERVLPVVVAEVALEGVVEQGARGRQRVGVQLGGLGDPQLAHSPDATRAGAVGGGAQRCASRSARSMSRLPSRSLIASRLSKRSLPLASAISTFARPSEK